MHKETVATPHESTAPPRIAVIIPVFNRRQLVLDALESLHAQSLPPWKIVVVDDGSSDGSADAVENWLREHPMPCQFQIVRQANGGVSRARNRGVKEAHGADVLAFLDSDDLWPDDFMARVSAGFVDAPDAAAVYFNAELRDHAADGTVLKTKTREHDAHRLQGAALIHAAYPGTPAIAVRATVFAQVGGFPVGIHLGEDTIFFLLVSEAGPWVHAPGKPVIYRYFASGDGPAHLSSARSPEVFRDFAIHLDAAATKHGLQRELRFILGQRWRRAGKAMKEAGRIQEAHDCYQRALEVNPWDLKARWRKCRLG